MKELDDSRLSRVELLTSGGVPCMELKESAILFSHNESSPLSLVYEIVHELDGLMRRYYLCYKVVLKHNYSSAESPVGFFHQVCL